MSLSWCNQVEIFMKRYLGVVAAAAMLAGTLAVATDALAAGHRRGLGSGDSTHRWHQFAHPATMPYGPEYGFLAHVPPNAIRMPGYTFVPGVGILGESCDLPTSACSNEYRDVK
jgi:hypothetical protein